MTVTLHHGDARHVSELEKAARRVKRAHEVMRCEIREHGDWRTAVDKYHKAADALIALAIEGIDGQLDLFGGDAA